MTVSTTRPFTANVSLQCVYNLTRRKRLITVCRLPPASVCSRHKFLAGEMSLYFLLQYAMEGISLGLCAGSIKNRFPGVAGNPAAKGADG